MKLDQTDRLMLSILVEREKYSLEILSEYKAATGKELSTATFYTTLTRLERAGLVSDRLAGERERYFHQRRKYFAITETGYKLLRSGKSLPLIKGVRGI